HYGYGMPMHVGPPPAIVPGGPIPPPPIKEKSKTTELKIGLNAAPANVVVSLPANAELFANGQRTAQTKAERRFVTPELPAGQVFQYVFTAAIERDGKTVTETKQVEVVAGGSVRVEFDFADAT